MLVSISDVLVDTENRSINDKSLHGWLRKLRDAAFDADDVVDEFQKRLRKIVASSQRCMILFSLNNAIIFHHKIARKVKEIIEQLDQILEERLKYHLSERSILERPFE